MVPDLGQRPFHLCPATRYREGWRQHSSWILRTRNCVHETSVTYGLPCQGKSQYRDKDSCFSPWATCQVHLCEFWSHRLTLVSNGTTASHASGELGGLRSWTWPRRPKHLLSTEALVCGHTDCTSSTAAQQAWEVSPGDKRGPSGQGVCTAASQKRICILSEVPQSRNKVPGP